MKRKALAFDVPQAIQKAWDFLWGENLKRRADEKNLGGRWYAETYYLTAADIERQVRSWAQDTYDGNPWNMTRSYGSYGQYGFKFRGNLKHTIRNWLFDQARHGVLEYHNFGRGHISGARFRPRGEPMAPAEVKTVTAKEERRRNPKPRPEHFSEHGYSGLPLCTEARRSPYSRNRGHTRCTHNKEEVTCKRCLNLLVSYVPPAQRVTETNVETGD